ncbi:Universal stress protein family protein [Mucilaginibacter gossypiicola]|uniref:Universal stress protein family protein n=1 Tax=Mucilaginibacter gossypiicola TaxID=551995 RepID=A0A1H8UGF1_9SPHI|nr:hypothetical protein [Mucilaginibacter gossypiicola]SEP02299.1 Universal stress protein family protein [Mucilaginibacter gossypiicola]
MKAILVVHNLKKESNYALTYASNLGAKLNNKVIVMNTVPEPLGVQLSDMSVQDVFEGDDFGFKDQNKTIENVVFLSYLDTLGMSLHAIIAKYDIDLIIKGVSGTAKEINEQLTPILNHSSCPLLAVPEEASFNIANMGYLADLRYAKKDIVSFLNKMSEALDVNASLFNITESGLPHMNDGYAETVFRQLFSNSNLNLVNIRERDIMKTVDVLANVMQVDFFVLSNRSSQLNGLWDWENMENEEHAHLPALIFPC